MNLNEIKTYLRIDSNADDDLLMSLTMAAEQYVEYQSGKKYVASDEVWSTCVKLIVAHWYENRLPVPEKNSNVVELPHSADALIRHISMCSLYEALS
jgi:uncharacterized phage protein (predicted DNA packaging)